jgi:ABC-type transporter Mla subunit MlaD
LWNFLQNAVITAHTLNEEQGNLDSALMGSIGFGNTGADVFERGGPYLVRGAQDLIPTSQLLDEYSPEIFCTIRNYHDVAPKVAESLGGGKRLLAPLAGRSDTRRGESLRLSGQPAAHQRPRRTGGPARLLAADHPGSVAVPVPGDGHRCFHRAL